ncbi:BTAD domain-containing putative transcriptional regulator [Embleya sp. NBC_00896]|uniref:AfsR/SARP family transcriptional regulator n=1 Tax=Embleya sp. NBC_00896 TaxID=2975961 RepID=UPI00386CB524|nr:AfsR/SARP family transcriptional regulator [Embleya sp. NBC_00896]
MLESVRIRQGAGDLVATTAGVGVLGPVELWPSGGRPYAWRPIAGARPRVLLALLAASIGKVVPVERILAEVWPTGVPATRGKAVAQVVLRLRRLLGDDAGGIVVTRPGGYELAEQRVELDAHVAAGRVESGCAALAAGDPATAAELLGDALGRWRGEPYAGVDPADPAGPVACHRGALLRLRVSAQEARIDANLALGRHRQVVDELAGLVARDPLYEPWWPRLMVALYRSGRRADALQAYRSLRGVLVDRLGVEPGPDARRLQQLILAGDIVTPPCGCGASASPPVGPRT